MADETHQPHNAMVQAVFNDLAEAISWLQLHLPQTVSQALNWPTLKLIDRSFIDDDLRSSEADFLYEIEHISGEASVWIYILLEHQSTTDKWMRFRLLKYCCRIWDMDLGASRKPRELRPIVPLVLYQGRRRWTYSTEFADLFAESVRDWPGIPHFSHGLVDQSRMQPDEFQGDLKTRIMQVLLLAASHPTRAWMEQLAELWPTLAALPPSGGINYIRVFVWYMLETQEQGTIQSFREVLRDHAPGAGDVLMTYAQELLKEGEIRTQVRAIEGFLQEGVEWPVIERAMGINETQFQALKQQVAEMDSQ